MFLMISNIYAKESPIQSGPMLGYSDFFECLIWIQTKAEANVKVQYWIKGDKKEVFETKQIHTNEDSAYIAKFITNKVLPGNVYEYRILVENKEIQFDYPLEFQTQKLWEWITDPPNFKFALGSCFFVNDSIYDRKGKPYGSDYQIMKTIYNNHPDFMIWMGDNVYLREPDWNTKTGIFYRYTNTRSLPELQPLLASTHHYAIWDDHDFGPNDSDRGFFNKKNTLDAFKLFWGNFTYGVNEKPGITSKFTWGDVDVFLMDGRYYKSPNKRTTGKREGLGDEQIEWLIDNLKYSKAPFKLVTIGSEFISSINQYENFATYPEERKKIIDMITAEKITGVIFITGDRHFSEVSKLDRPNTYPLYDFTISSFTAGSNATGCDEKNLNRVDGSCYNKHNFGIIEVSGKRKERVLKLNIISLNNEIIFTKEFKENELK
jgi:alkaline phosphatase D